MKRLLSFILSILLCASSVLCVDLSTFAATTTYNNGEYTYKIISSASKTIQLTKYSGSDEILDIPETFGAYTITSLAAGFGDYASSVKVVNIPKTVTEISSYFYGSFSIEEYNVADENEYYKSVDGLLYTKNCERLLRCPTVYSAETIVLPEGVRTIGKYAFANNTSNTKPTYLTEIVLPSTLEVIEDYGLANAYFKHLNLPDSVVSAGKGAFSNGDWESIYIGAGLTSLGSVPITTLYDGAHSNVTSIKVSEENTVFSAVDNVLYGDGGKSMIYYPYCKKDLTFVVPDDVTTIKTACFSYGSAPETIDFNNVVKLESDAYWNACSKRYILSEEMESFAAYCGSKPSFDIYLLNPDCKIGLISSSSVYTVNLYGYYGSTAEVFANTTTSQATVNFYSIDAYSPESIHLDIPISFGSYPQHRVISESLISKLNSVDAQWNSYNYYSGTGSEGSAVQGDYMLYTDIEYNSKRYRGVKLLEYRPLRAYLAHRTNYSYQDDNGYELNTVYWFEYQPIKWIVLNKQKGLVVSEKVLDNQHFSELVCTHAGKVYNSPACTDYANNYATSSIRYWLNNDFYNTAFTDEEKQLINTAQLLNIGYSSEYDYDETYDKVFLLSFNEVAGYDADHIIKATSSRLWAGVGSDYSQAQGLMVQSGSYQGRYYIDSGSWLLRTAGESTDTVCNVSSESKLCTTHNASAYDGIRPAIKLSTVSGVQENEECRHSETRLIGYKKETCKTAGYTGDTVCNKCNATIEQGSVIPMLSHDFSVKENVEPTCTEQGSVTYICSMCGEVETQVIEKTEHTVITDSALEPSCTESGLTQGSHCEVCKEIIVPQKELAPVGHTIVIDSPIPSTYYTTGLTEGRHCEVCGEIIVKQETTPLLVCNHSLVNTVVLKPASMTEKGTVKLVCNDCEKTLSTQTVLPIRSATLSKTSLVYNGKSLAKPKVTVKDSGGNLVSSDNYTVSYISRSTGKAVSTVKAVGQYKVKLTFKGKYTGTRYLYFTVKPSATAVKTLSTSAGSITAKWSKNTSATGYQLVIATDKAFTKNKKTIKLTKNSTVSYKFKNLKKGKRYYVKIRPYKNVKVDGKNTTIYANYSKTKSIVCK